MDRETLLAHRDRWTTEERPAASSLTRLTQAALALFAELVSDSLADRVRLEQERVDWQWADQYHAPWTDSSWSDVRAALKPGL